MSSTPPADPPRLRGLLFAIFVSSMPATLILPMLPTMGSDLGLDRFALGLLVGVYPLTSVIASPLWGRVSDRLGRKPALLGSLAGAALAFVSFGFATSYQGLFLARALQGLSGSARGIGFAVMSDTTEGGERAAGMGSVSAAMAAAFTLGPILGAAFMGEHPGRIISALRQLLGAPATGFDHLLPSLIGAILNIAAFAIVALGFHETWRKASRTENSRTGARSAGLSREAITVAVAVFMLQLLMSGVIQGTLQFSFTLWAHQVLGWRPQQLALSLAALGIGFVISSGGTLRPLLRRFPAEHVVLIGVLVDLSGMSLFIAGASDWRYAITGLGISSFGGGLWGTTVVGLISQATARAHQGLILGIANGIALIGRVAGPPVAGLLVEGFGPRSPFFGILACLALIFGTALGPAIRRKSFRGG
jgi:MFS family permease